MCAWYTVSVALALALALAPGAGLPAGDLPGAWDAPPFLGPLPARPPLT